MASMRIERIAELIKETLGDLLMKTKDPRIGFVTITRVKVAPDLDSARVFVSILGSEAERQSTLEGLESSAGYLRNMMGKEIRLRKIPRLFFQYDPSVEEGARILQLLNKVADEEGTAGEDTEATPEDFDENEEEE